MSILRYCYLMIVYTGFIKYVFGFYSPKWIYPYAFTLQEIVQALDEHLDSGKPFRGDSHDREAVRELIFAERGDYGEVAR